MRQNLLCAAFRGRIVASLRRSRPQIAQLMENVPAADQAQPRQPAQPPGPAAAAGAPMLHDTAPGVRTLTRHA